MERCRAPNFSLTSLDRIRTPIAWSNGILHLAKFDYHQAGTMYPSSIAGDGEGETDTNGAIESASDTLLTLMLLTSTTSN